MLVLLAWGLLAQILLTLLLVAIGVALVMQLDLADDELPRRCPACGLDQLKVLDMKYRKLRCHGCDVDFRRERDGRLTRLDPV